MTNKYLREGTQVAFSLIELLVVIAIIAVLAAVLSATAMIARQKMQATKCASNLHQLGIAARLYANEAGGEVPYANYWSPTGTTWVTKLAPYVEDITSAERGSIEEGALPEEAFRCPSCDYPIYGGSRSHYGKNYFINGLKGGPGQLSRTTGYTFSNINDPAKYYFLADSAPNANGFAGREIGTGTTDPNLKAMRGIQARHSGYANVLFMDLHVDAVRLEDIPAVIDYGHPPWCPNE